MKKTVLKKYAELLVKKGVNLQKGQELIIRAEVNQAEFVTIVAEAAYKAGASRVDINWLCESLQKVNYKYRTVESLAKYEKWELERMQHRIDYLPAEIAIVSADPDGMKGVDTKKVAEARALSYPILKPYNDQLSNKEQWCVAGAASKEWARKVFPDLPIGKAVEKLWEAILETSRVVEDPIYAWELHNEDLRMRSDYLNHLNLKKLHYTSSNGTDLTIGLIPGVRWMGGSDFTKGTHIEFNPNIPSEEVFTTPMKGEAEGIVYSARPLSYQGQLIENFSMRFENGKAVEVHAEKGEELLKQMVTMDETAGYLGEVALIPFDSPVNNTGILFLETLYDENASCHLAVGSGFNAAIKDYEKYTLEEIQAMGVNDSMIHVDFMIGTEDLHITGITEEGAEIEIFKDGNWAF